MKLREGQPECRNCGKPIEKEDSERSRLCRSCRGEVIRRATLWSRIAGVIVATVLAFYVFGVVQPGERFLIGWVALVVLSYFGVAKLTRRIAYDLIRSRGVPPAS